MNNANEPAFPCGPDGYEPDWGMTKREFISAMCLQGILSNYAANSNPGDTKSAHENDVSVAVMYADALLAALEEDDGKEG